MRTGYRVVLSVAVAVCTAVPAAAQPPPPEIISPRGVVEGTTHVFSWRARAGATWYHLWVADALSNPKVAEWYTAAQAGCPEDSGMCSVPLSIGFAAGQGYWWVRSYNAGGSGPWSPAIPLVVRHTAPTWDARIAGSTRFELVLGGQAALDRETGLVWERVPFASTMTWANARVFCYGRITGGRAGWRTPRVEELATLYDPATGLPSGHPFVVNLNPNTWSATPTVDPGFSYSLNFHGGLGVTVGNTSNGGYVWCVRGGEGRSTP
jgi:hypothetical protein